MQRVALGSLAVAAAGSAYLAYEARRLARLYPISGPQPYHTTGAVLASTHLPPTIHGKIDPKIDDYVYTTVALDPAARHVAANPTDAWVRAFYQTWTLRVEGAVTKNWEFYKSHHDELSQTTPERLDTASAFGVGGLQLAHRTGAPAIESGLFPILQRAPNLVVYFRIPDTPAAPLVGGTQELAAVPVDGGKLELSYGCTVAREDEDAPMPKWVYEAHLFYMRYLIDRGARRLEKWIKEDAARCRRE